MQKDKEGLEERFKAAIERERRDKEQVLDTYIRCYAATYLYIYVYIYIYIYILSERGATRSR